MTEVGEGAGTDRLVVPAGLRRRVFARVIDSVVCGGAAGLAVAAGVDTESSVVFTVAVAAYLAYEAGMLVVWNATLGKLLLGLRVFRFDGGGPLSVGRAAGRVGAYTLIGAVPCGIGQVIMLVSAANDLSGWRRAWHDRVAGTVVVKTA